MKSESTILLLMVLALLLFNLDTIVVEDNFDCRCCMCYSCYYNNVILFQCDFVVIDSLFVCLPLCSNRESGGSDLLCQVPKFYASENERMCLEMALIYHDFKFHQKYYKYCHFYD